LFVKACESAANFTRPLVISARQLNDKISTGMGALIALNAEGWIVTAAHNITILAKFNKDRSEVEAYDAAVAALADEPNDSRRRSKARRIPKDAEWLRNLSIMWGYPGVQADAAHAYPDIDVAVCHLDHIERLGVKEFPVFRDPNDMPTGTSLVKVGFPFHEIGSSWDEAKQCFDLQAGALPAPLFPIEGIHTRVAAGPSSKDGFPVKYVETSSPGLRGQSGGPTLDRDGSVWAMQTQTAHLALGFRPKVVDGRGRNVEEHQFLNVGRGVHAETLKAVFDRHGITVAWT
jgi:hypothetical protein